MCGAGSVRGGADVLSGMYGESHERQDELRARFAAAWKGDLRILPSVRQDLFDDQAEIRQDALETLLVLGPKARGELGLIQRYRALYPWDEHAVVVLAALGGADAEREVNTALSGPNRFAVLARWIRFVGDYGDPSIDVKPYAEVLRDIAASDPRFGARYRAQQLLASIGVEVFIAPHRCWPTNSHVEDGWNGSYHVATANETDIGEVTYRVGRSFETALSPGGAPCESARKSAKRRLWHPTYFAAENGCLLGDARGEWGGVIEYQAASGELCTLHDYVHIMEPFEWRNELWVLENTMYPGMGSALQRIAFDSAGPPRAQEPLSLGGYAVRWSREQSGALLFLLSVNHWLGEQCEHPDERDTGEYLLLRVYPDLSLEAVGGLVAAPGPRGAAQGPTSIEREGLDRHRRPFPLEYGCPVDFLESLASRVEPPSVVYDPADKSHIDLDGAFLMDRISERGVALDREYPPPPLTDWSRAEIRAQLQARAGDVFDRLVHVGRSYVARHPAHSGLEFARSGESLRVEVGTDQYELTFEVQDGTCKLAAIRDRVVEGPH